MRGLSVLLMAAPLFGQSPAVEVIGATQTQAAIAIRNYSGACTLELSESPTFSPVVPDVDPFTYGGSNVDTSRLDTLTWQDGTRVVTLGHQTDDRALAAATTYYLRVSNCGGTVSTSLSTPTLGTASTMQWPVPTNPNKWANLGYPSIDLLNPKTYVDPITGVKLRPLNLARHWSFRTGGGSGATFPFSQPGSNAFADWAGGAGWTNAAGVLTGSASTASTGGTNPLDVYTGADTTWFGYRTLDDLGILVYGSASSNSSPDNQIQLCIFLNPNSGCIGAPITVALPAGPVAQVLSNGGDPDRPFPASFPGPLFTGWGINAPLPEENRNTTGTLTANAGALTIAVPDWQQHFSDALKAGNRIKVTGSGCSPNDMCTVASVTHVAAAATSENITVVNAPFIAYGWGVRVQKVTGAGTVTVGLRFKVAGSRTVGTQAGVPPCSKLPVVAGDGKRGYVCEMNSPVAGTDWLYFVADDGTVRRFAIPLTPQHQAQINSMPVQDRPSGVANIPLYPLGFDPADPNVFYAPVITNAGGLSVFKLTYTGDYTQDLDYQYAGGPGGDEPDNYTPALDNLQWANLMAPSQGMDLQTQIATRFPSYQQALYGNWSSNVGFAGISGGKAYFYKVYSGQDGGPGWIAVVDLPSGVVSNLIHTADGTGTNGYIRWGALHSAQAAQAVPNTLFLADNVLNSNDPGRLHGGPFQAPITGVLRAGAWSGNTALSWPPDSSYDNACPAGNQYEFMGAVGNQCVTIRLPRGGACNVAPASIEKSTWPCPWNSNYAQPFSLTPGAVFSDAGGGVDDEKFRILSMANEPDGQLRLVAQRNAMWDYCCAPGTHASNGVSNCVGVNSQFLHANGWQVRMYPPTLNGCATGTFVFNMTLSSIGEVSRLYAGHGDIAAGLQPGDLSFLTSGTVKPDAPFTSLFSLPTRFATLGAPAFAGVPSPIGTNLVQSYPSRITSNLNADPNSIPWMTDTNALNPSLGVGREILSNSIGARTLTPAGSGIYGIQVLGTLNYKLFPLIGWAGRFVLKDVSGPGANLNSAPDYSVCYALSSGECVSGSAAGQVYVRVPFAYDTGACVTGVSWANTPCVVSGLPSAGGVRQQAIDQSDSGGRRSRFLTYLFASPGQHYPFTQAGWLTDGKTLLAPGSHFVNGWGTVGWLIQLPPWREDSQPRNGPISVPVSIAGGSQFAEIQFGYGRYGTPAQLYCTPRAEACNTSTPPGSLFNFESEARSLTGCASGCTINIPVIAPNLVYYRVRLSQDGVNWVNQDTQVKAMP